MQRALISLFRWLPLWVLYAVMALVIPFYMLLASGFRASYRFFRRRMGYGALRSFFHVYLNEFRMGTVVLDRFAAYAGKMFDIQVLRMDLFDALEKGEGGFLMLSSHTGCYEMAGYKFVSKRKTIHALVFPGETQTMSQNRSRMFASTNVKMVPVQEDLSHIFILSNALSDGQIVSMPGDRAFGSNKLVRVPFFGEDAAFPAGPFTLAAQREVPVLSVFVMKEGYGKYRAYLEQLPLCPGLPRSEQVRTMAAAYAACLESIVRKYPDQWYNFYDFWK